MIENERVEIEEMKGNDERKGKKIREERDKKRKIRKTKRRK